MRLFVLSRNTLEISTLPSQIFCAVRRCCWLTKLLFISFPTDFPRHISIHSTSSFKKTSFQTQRTNQLLGNSVSTEGITFWHGKHSKNSICKRNSRCICSLLICPAVQQAVQDDIGRIIFVRSQSPKNCLSLGPNGVCPFIYSSAAS